MLHFIIDVEDRFVCWLWSKYLVFLGDEISFRFYLTYLWRWIWLVLSLSYRPHFSHEFRSILLFFIASIWRCLYFNASSFWKISGQFLFKVFTLFILFLACVVEAVEELREWLWLYIKLHEFWFGLLRAAADRVMSVDGPQVLEKYLDFTWLLNGLVIMQPFFLLFFLLGLVFNRW